MNRETTDLIQQELMRMKTPMVWSVAGSDNSSGAGIQADNKVFDRFGVRSANIVTALTAQNHTGLHAVHVCSSTVFDEQWRSLVEQAAPSVIKLGMLANEAIVSSLMNKLALSTTTVVCDPVLKATTGGSLLQGKGSALYHRLLDHVDVLTPNQEEFCELFSIEVNSLEGLMTAAVETSQLFSVDLVITGGESFISMGRYAALAIDVCVVEGESFYLESPLQETTALHGTGCSFSSAIAASIALGYSVKEAVVLAKSYLNQGLSASAMEEELAALSNDLLEGEHLTKEHRYSAFLHTQFPSLLAYLPNVVASYEGRDDLFSSVSCDYFPVINEQLGLYPVVDSVEWIDKCLQAGVKTIQLRVKDIEPELLDKIVEQAAKLGRQYKARLFINDHWQLAIKHNAYGVHLGQEDLAIADLNAIHAAGLHLGVSTHSWFEIARAHSLKPSYIAIGPIYETTTKVMPWKPQGLENLYEWNALLARLYPVVAIGGINADNAEQVLATGVGSIAMVRAITEAGDHVAAIDVLNGFIEQYR